MGVDTVFIGAAIFLISGGLLWLAAIKISDSSLSLRAKQVFLSLIVVAVAGIAVAVIDYHASTYKAEYESSKTN